MVILLGTLFFARVLMIGKAIAITRILNIE
jgi:hypothetical protein